MVGDNMNAQEKWLEHYRKFRVMRSKRYKRIVKSSMRRFTREAALERIIARQARRIEYLEADLKLAQEQTAECEERREFAARMEFGG